ncbi:MAG: agmatine deiminase family protein, partial [Sulfurimonadaceae bacterium]|nr:agmatine deiminase family protein [Sulfurimonadaceae bacterium]
AARRNFVDIAQAVARFQPCLVVCNDIEHAKTYFPDNTNLYFVHYLGDDTWARDCSGITVYDNGEPLILDFTFTGWGGKFDAALDNAMTGSIANHYSAPVKAVKMILEGGGIESNGKGVLLTTEECLLNPNRNKAMTRSDVESALQQHFGIEKTLWLAHGYLAGDDTDSHIDTLARFVSEDTIMYVTCDDASDEHYKALQAMETELRALRTPEGIPFKLVALPMCDPLYYDGERLPATYANFLIINGAVLVPTYDLPQDAAVLEIFRKTMPSHEIVPVDCSVLVRQHGSLHCVTMQFPKGVEPRDFVL